MSASVRSQAADIAARMRADMRTTVAQHLGETAAAVMSPNLLEALVDDGMAPVEHLLVENEHLLDRLSAADAL